MYPEDTMKSNNAYYCWKKFHIQKNYHKSEKIKKCFGEKVT